MTTRRPCSLGLCLVILFLMAAPAVAQEEAMASRIWNFEVKPGMSAEFEAAAQEHIAFLAEQPGHWPWTAFVVETGDRVGEYGFVSGPHPLSAFDAYDAQMRDIAMASFRDAVMPYVASMRSSLVAPMPEISRAPAPDATFAMVQVITFHVRFDHADRFEAAVAHYHQALEGATYTWSRPMSGFEGGPMYSVLLYHDSWASMAPGDSAMDDAMVGMFGLTGASMIGNDFSASVSSVDNWIARLRPDLSTPTE